MWKRKRKPQTRVYGLDRTIHQTEHVDVEIGPDGHVAAVWFRCSVLPFEETRVNHNRAEEMRMTKGYEEPMVGVVFRGR